MGILSIIKFVGGLKDVITVVSIVSTMALGYLSYQQKERADRAENNLYKKEIQWTTAKGELVTETTELRFTVDDLKRAAAKDSTERSATEQMLNKAKERIEELNTNLSHVVSYSNLKMEAVHRDLETVALVSNNKLDSIAPIDTKHLKVDFEVLEDNRVKATAKYSAEVDVVVGRERRKTTKKGKERFFVARWLKPDWQYSSKAVCNDPDAKILSNVDINFDNRKQWIL